MSEESKESPGRQFKFQYGILSDVGRKREENQDSHGHAHTALASVFIVADGMGGAKGGATASAIAVDVILKSIFTPEGDITPESVGSSLRDANLTIFEESQVSDELNGMGTTAVTIAFSADKLFVGHVGDSRAYLLRDKELRRLTRDHTLVQELVDSGAIGQSEAHNHPISHMLTRSLGPTGNVEAEVMTYIEPAVAGDVFLLCCDGLYNLVSDGEIQTVLNDFVPQNAAEKLVEMALERGAPDNVTVEVIKLHELKDESIEFVVPEPGKLRLLASREAPQLKYPEMQAELAIKAAEEAAAAAKDEQEAKEKAEKEKAEKLKAEEPKTETVEAEFPAEEEKKEEDDGEEKENREREEESLRKLVLVGSTIVLGAIIILSYFFLIRADTRKALITLGESATNPSNYGYPSSPTAVPLLLSKAGGEQTPVPVPSSIPDTAMTPSGSRVDDLLQPFQVTSVQNNTGSANTIPTDTIPSNPVQPNTQPNLVPTLEATTTEEVPPLTGTTGAAINVTPLNPYDVVFSPEERAALEVALSFTPPPAPKLKKNYFPDEPVEPINWEKERAAAQSQQPAKIFSSAEKSELSVRKASLRGELVELDVKLLALDAETERDFRAVASKVEQRLRLLEALQDKSEEVLRALRAQAKSWDDRMKNLQSGDPGRLGSELSTLDPEVAKVKTELDTLQAEYQSVLSAWNLDRKNQDLVSRTAILSKEMKGKRGELDGVIRAAVDRGLRSNIDSLVLAHLAKANLSQLVEQFQRQVGFLKVAQSNSGGRNDLRLKQLVQDRKATAKQLQELSIVFPESEERAFLETYTRNMMQREP